MAKENSSITNAFKILTLLKQNGNMQISELIKELSVEERQVRRYVNSLRNAGIDIKSSTGIHGGYHIEKCPFCGKELE